ncbi:asparaginase [Palaeococcus ferrophilus]|uniref:asparaginase n=1 Tax=Palaeococcus ferrophilus TaxID=83868 RepID=UPI00064E5F19|nr:asparaginase [Palaeococcus ferrophilus]
MKRLLILGTGGTIASSKGEEGYKASLSVDEVLELAGIKRSNGFKIESKDVLNVDSTLIQPEDWETIAREVFRAREEYDGVVITHGTDTLAYTASMLTFMLPGMDIPVVLTGSMRPITEERSDAPRNVRTAISFALTGVPGVFVAFNDKIMLGVRASKVRALGINAFQSVNYPDVAYVKGDEIYYNLPPSSLVPKGEPGLEVHYEPRVAFIRLLPGMEPAFLDGLVSSGCKGLILEGYGAGGLPYRRRNILEKVGELAKRIPVVMTTQALYDGVDLNKYEVGRKALQAGVIPAKDMTKEATVTKLMWALGKTQNVEEIREIMLKNIAGEISEG